MLNHPVWTVVSLDENILKIAQGLRRDRPLLSALLVKKITGLSDEALAQELHAALASLPHKTASIDFLLPRHVAILRTLELPSTDEHEIQELAGFQAVKQTPYALDEIVWDAKLLQKDPAGVSKVALIVVQKEIVDRMLGIARQARAQVSAMRLASQGCEGIFSEIAQGHDGAFCMIDHARSLLLVFAGGKARYSRSMPLGRKDMGQSVDVSLAFQNKLIRELNLSFKACHKENPGLAVKKIWFEPGVTDLEEIKKYAEQEGLGEPQTLDPMQAVQTDGNTRLLLDKDLDIACSDVLGALANPRAMTADLLPEDYARARRAEKTRRNLLQSALFGSALLGLVLIFALEQAADKALYLAKLNKNIRAIKEKVAETEARSEKLDIARNLARNQGHVLRVLRELYERIPEGISLSTLSYERDRALIIKGTAKDLSDVFQFIPVLEKSPYFESVASQYASKRKVLDKEYTDFQIQCTLSS